MAIQPYSIGIPSHDDASSRFVRDYVKIFGHSLGLALPATLASHKSATADYLIPTQLSLDIAPLGLG